jgi:hypothetical protein
VWPDPIIDADGQLVPSGASGPDLPVDEPAGPVPWWEGPAVLVAFFAGVWWLLL